MIWFVNIFTHFDFMADRLGYGVRYWGVLVNPRTQEVLGHTRLGLTRFLSVTPSLKKCRRLIELLSESKYEKPSVLKLYFLGLILVSVQYKSLISNLVAGQNTKKVNQRSKKHHLPMIQHLYY